MNLLIVEPDDSQAEVYRIALEDKYQVQRVKNFEEAVHLNAHTDYHLVICEWKIEGMTASCMVKPKTEDRVYSLPIVMVVSEDNRDHTMAEAFKNGISYYYAKPYNVFPFVENLNSLRCQLQIMEQMGSDKADIQQTTTTAISQAAIYGVGMEIIASACKANTKRDIAKRILQSLRLHGVHAALCFHVDDDEIETFDTDLTPCDPTTVKVFSLLKDKGRIYWFGRRLMLNDESVSLLVKNVAGDDKMLYDAILDMGAKLIPALETRVQTLKQQDTLLTTQADVHTLLGKLHTMLLNSQREKVRIIDAVCEAIGESFHKLAMTEEQEAFFVNLIDKELQSKVENNDLVEISELVQEISARLLEQNLSFSAQDDTEDQQLSVELF